MGLSVSERPTDLGSDLLVKIQRRLAIHLDAQHDTRHTSFIPVEAPSIPPTQQELDALIEEARQRARRRRMGYAAVIATTAIGIAVAIAFGGGGSGGDTPTDVESGGPQPAGVVQPVPNHFASLELETCSRRQVPSGGYDVQVVGLNCQDAAKLVLKLGLPLSRQHPTANATDRGNGWTCWSKVISGRGGAQVVCWHREQLVAFKVA